MTCSNFFGRYIHPLGSDVITEMAKFRGLRERVALFLPLQLYLTKELQRDSGMLVVDGVYAPQNKQEVKSMRMTMRSCFFGAFSQLAMIEMPH